MSRKTLNKANLEKLGPETLAALVMDLVQGSAALQRRARMELSAAQGPEDIAADLRKRFASLRRATSHVGWRKQRALVKDLNSLLVLIENRIAPQDANEAFELLWCLLQLAPSILERTDDNNGAIGDVLRHAVDLVGQVAPRVTMDPHTLAGRILDAVADAGHGEFDGIIPATAEALGPDGLAHLRQITTAWADTPPTAHELAACQRIGLSSAPAESVRRARQSTCSIILADVADAQGDVDAYIDRYSAEQLTSGTIAPDVARRLLVAGRVHEAHDIMRRSMAREADAPLRMFNTDLDEVYEDCLERLGMLEDLKAHLWGRFQDTLSARALRKLLKLLPDFDDIEAEEKAIERLADHPRVNAALGFLIDWPALDRAAGLVLARVDELDANAFSTLSHAAEELDARHPLAATLIRRAMIEDTLTSAKSKRYRHAARHLAECRVSDMEISDYGAFLTHERFIEALRQTHGRKYGFWALVDG